MTKENPMKNPFSDLLVVSGEQALAEHSGLNRIRASTSKGTEVTMAAPPIRKSIDAGHGLSSPPKLGQHTESVFGEFGDL